jgi:hypothetical protein
VELLFSPWGNRNFKRFHDISSHSKVAVPSFKPRQHGSRVCDLNLCTMTSPRYTIAFYNHHPDVINLTLLDKFSTLGYWLTQEKCIQRKERGFMTFNFAYSPPHLSLVLFLACKDNGYKTYHFAPFFSSFCRALLSFPTSICLNGNQWGDPIILAPAAAHTRSGTTPLSHTSGHSADASGRVQSWFLSQSRIIKHIQIT